MLPSVGAQRRRSLADRCCTRTGVLAAVFFLLLLKIRAKTGAFVSQRLVEPWVGNPYLHSAPRDLGSLLNPCFPRRRAGVHATTHPVELDAIADLMARFASHNILVVLDSGSMLGAERHFGMLPWGDKDFDLAVFSTIVI